MLCSYPLDRYSLSKQIDLISIDMMLTINSFYKKSITVHDDGTFIVIIVVVHNYYFYI